MKLTGKTWATINVEYYKKFREYFPTLNLTEEQTKYVFDEAVKAVEGSRGAVSSNEVYSTKADY
ncbi:MAG: hypothetical protein DRJ03_02560 [Chloroflexi bacterium]|nr:MAG: hypothetical protein DRJ03_02560 [Chloroflexota bacterium]